MERSGAPGGVWHCGTGWRTGAAAGARPRARPAGPARYWVKSATTPVVMAGR